MACLNRVKDYVRGGTQLNSIIVTDPEGKGKDVPEIKK